MKRTIKDLSACFPHLPLFHLHSKIWISMMMWSEPRGRGLKGKAPPSRHSGWPLTRCKGKMASLAWRKQPRVKHHDFNHFMVSGMAEKEQTSLQRWDWSLTKRKKMVLGAMVQVGVLVPTGDFTVEIVFMSYQVRYIPSLP